MKEKASSTIIYLKFYRIIIIISFREKIDRKYFYYIDCCYCDCILANGSLVYLLVFRCMSKQQNCFELFSKTCFLRLFLRFFFFHLILFKSMHDDANIRIYFWEFLDLSLWNQFNVKSTPSEKFMRTKPMKMKSWGNSIAFWLEDH